MNNNIVKLIDEYMVGYSMYTIYNRAIPTLLDGLKPSQRCILETVKNVTNFEKCANISGRVMELLPHGDSYPTIVGMIQLDNNNISLITGKGSFSGRTSRDCPAASSRYTECKVNDFGKIVVGNREEVELIPSYDGKKMLPTSFSPDFPLILLNGSLGIATGFATNIPQYNLKEICEQTIRVIEGKKYKHIFPDFSTGGYINNVEVLDNSSMKYTLRAKCEIEKNAILVKEIPYNTTREEIIEKIENLYKEGVLAKELKDVDDLTDKNGLLIEISLKKGVNVEETLNKLYSLTPLQTNFTTNIGYIHNNRLVYSGVEELLKNWVEVKSARVIAGTKKKLEKINKELDIVDGLQKTRNDIKWLGEYILNTEDKNLEKTLVKKYNISITASEYITNLGIKFFKETYFDKKIKESENLIKKKEELLEILETNGSKEMIRRLKDIIKKYGSERKTEIKSLTLDKVKATKIVEEFKGYITITERGYIYKTKTPSVTTVPGDKIISTTEVKDQGEVLFFVRNGDCHKFALEDIKIVGAKDMGYYTGLQNIVGGVYIEKDYKYVCKIYKDTLGAKISKEPVESYLTTTKRKKLSNSLYLEGELLDVRITTDEDMIDFTTIRGKIKRVKLSEVTVKKARDSQGVCVCKNLKEFRYV